MDEDWATGGKGMGDDGDGGNGNTSTVGDGEPLDEDGGG